MQVFGTIRAIAPFRLTGASRDYLIIGSDSGRIVIVEYDKASSKPQKTAALACRSGAFACSCDLL